jgi:hypothetical protein
MADVLFCLIQLPHSICQHKQMDRVLVLGFSQIPANDCVSQCFDRLLFDSRCYQLLMINHHLCS